MLRTRSEIISYCLAISQCKLSCEVVVMICNTSTTSLPNMLQFEDKSILSSCLQICNRYIKSNDSSCILLAFKSILPGTSEASLTLLVRILSLFNLLPMSCLMYGYINCESRSFQFLQWLHPTSLGNVEDQVQHYNQTFTQIHQSLANSDEFSMNLKGFSLSTLESILSRLDCIVDKRFQSEDYFSNENDRLYQDFKKYIDSLEETEKIRLHKQSNKPCNIFYIFNDRIMMRDSMSKRKVYINIIYDSEDNAGIVGLNKKGVGNNDKFTKIFYNTKAPISF